MNHRIARFVLASMVGLMAATAWAVQPGNPAPDFNAQDTHGQTHTLAQYKGKYVVLEWHNRECPYTQKHYASGNMQNLQREWTSKGVVWFTVISSAPGQQGYMTADQENAYLEKSTPRPRRCCWTPQGSWDICTAPRTHLTCLSLIRKGCSSTTAPSMTSRPPTRMTSPQPTTMCRRRCKKPWRANRSAHRPPSLWLFGEVRKVKGRYQVSGIRCQGNGPMFLAPR